MLFRIKTGYCKRCMLRKDGLVTTRRDGQTIYYALARTDISKLMAFLYETYCGEDAALN